MVYEPLMPNLFIAGVTKTGTSSLYWYLIQHPEICPPKGRKEIDYFTPMRWGRPPAGTPSNYGGYFTNCGGEKYRLDASPRYFDGGPALVKAVCDHSPQGRIIILLRDPACRIWSNYRTLKETGKIVSGLSFRQFFERGVKVYESGRKNYQQFTDHRAVSLGRYNDFLRDWFDVFGDNVLVLFFEHLVRDPRALVVSTCAWLGLDTEPADSFDYATRNKTIDPRSVRLSRVAYAINRRIDPTLRRIPAAKDAAQAAYALVNSRRKGETLSEGEREMVQDFYRPANRALHAELSRRGYTDLPPWLSSSMSAS